MKKLFVEFLFDYVEANFNYLILRNYENLPEDEGHDIDLLISSDEGWKIAELLKVIENKFPILIIKNYRYNNLKSHIIVFDNEILHLDFFTNVQWNRINLFDTSKLLEQKIRFKNKYWVINPNNFMEYCWYLHIIRKGNLKKEKYILNAFKWQNKKGSNRYGIDIYDTNSIKNKLLLFFHFFKQNPIDVIYKTFQNLYFKTKKLIHPYAKIFHPESNIATKDLCLNFCFIGYKEFNYSKKDYLALIKIYLALCNEHGVLVSDAFLLKNPILEKLFKKYFVKTTENLKNSVTLSLK